MAKPSIGELLDAVTQQLDAPVEGMGYPAHTLAARVEWVLALHKPMEQTFGDNYPYRNETKMMCVECDSDWPCPTVRALEGGE